MSENILKASLSEDYVVTNSVNEHQFISDEPISHGGQDLGPTPVDMLLASMASCKLITMKMYANRSGWELENVDIELSILERGEKTLISKKMTFTGNIDEKQRLRLIEISGRCPVVKMLNGSIEFKLIDA
jgi:putative redox protein